MMDSEDLTYEESEQLLALLLEEELAGTPQEQEPEIPVRAGGGDVPLSFAQQRLWLLDQIEPDNTSYSIAAALRMQGTLNIAALEECFNIILRRHESLRTIFPSRDGIPVQHILPALTLSLPLIDLSGLSAAQQETLLEQLASQESETPFPLAQGPLLRAYVVRLHAQEHILLLSMHHIVSDGWSLGVFQHELSLLYPSCCSHDVSPLLPLPIQYPDYALWQREWLHGPALERQRTFWLEQLQDAPLVLSLPTDFPRPPMLTSQGDRLRFTLPASLSQHLTTFSQQQGVTLFMTLLTAWSLLLARYSGQDDLLIGTPIANRTHAELETLIGCFVNTLVLRADLTGNPQLHELLARIRQRCLDAYARQDFPFERLVEALHPQRDLSHSPLFQAFFILQNTPVEPLTLPGLHLTPLPIARTTARFELSLSMQPSPTGLMGVLEYNRDLFAPSTIAAMASQLQTLLAAMVATPRLPINELPLLSHEEHLRMLHLASGPQQHFPQHLSLHQLFEEQVQRSPDAIALVCEDEQISYAELNQRATRLAHLLRSQGVGPEVLVGLCLERSPLLLIGIFAILKAGGAFVPLDPSYPGERLSFLLQDASIQILLTQHDCLSILPEYQGHLLCLDDHWSHIAEYSGDPLPSLTQPENLAYVIYTSGSTGQPKGAMNSHSGICNRLLWMQQEYQLTSTDRVLHKTPISFDVSVWEYTWPLLTGARLVLARPQGHQDSHYIRQLVQEQAITTIHFVPFMLQVWLQEQGIEGCVSLRRVMCSGEVLPLETERRFHQRLKASLYNLYGPTEAAIDVSAWKCQPDSTRGSVPLGRPIANTDLYILNAALQPVPLGAVGELYIGGVAIGRGYLGKADLTAERFVPHPWSQTAGARLYRTGDAARYLADGIIEYVGRQDGQIKLRGYRIEPGEIEAVLRRQSAVQDAVVLLREYSPGDKRLVGYVVLHKDRAFHADELRHYLLKHLPVYMVPATFIQLDSLPLHLNGKVDRLALPLPEKSPANQASTFVAPRTPTEELLASIWAEVLRCDHVGIHDNFFELGGDSILNILVITHARQAGLHFTPKQLFQHQTIAELSIVVNALPAIQTEQGLVSGPVLLTPIQSWFFEQAWADPQHFNQAMLLQIQARLNIALLEHALRHLMVQHDALRLRFRQEQESWQQFNAGPEVSIDLLRVDLTACSPAEQRTALETTASELQDSLQLANGPLFRVALFEMGAQQHARLLLVSHHLLIDGVSWRILLTDLQTAYQQLAQGEDVHLPPKTTSFQQWAAHLSAYAYSPALRHELTHWLAEERLRATPLPRDYPAGDNTRASALSTTVSLNNQETEALLHSAPNAYQTHINDLLLTALLLAFTDWTGSPQLLLDMEGHGREEILEDVDLSRTVGWLTTLFPVLLESAGMHNPGDSIKSVKEQIRHIPQRGIGYGILRYLNAEAEIAERLRALPPAEVRFNYLGQFDQVISENTLFALSGESSGPSVSQRGKRSYLLDINGLIVRGQLQIVWSYSQNIYKSTTIERLAQRFIQALKDIIAHCQSPEAGGYTPSDFPLARLDQARLDRFLTQITPQQRTTSAKIENLADIYELSPMQQGILFHTLYAPASGVYLQQMSVRLHGNLNRMAFHKAWQQVVDQHPVLRTAFYWTNLDVPLQVAYKQINLPWHEYDWRDIPLAQQQDQLIAYLRTDRQQGFELDHPPLMRFHLLQLDEQTSHFIWSYHHILLDGWSLSLLFKEVLACYTATCRNESYHLTLQQPYREYLAWLHQQDLDQAERFWRQTLKGFQEPTPLTVDNSIEGSRSPEPEINTLQVRLSTTLSAHLRSLVRQKQVTLNTLIQGAWGLLLSRYSGREEVLFGVTVSGRPPGIAGVETMIGLFINTLPLRVQVPPTAMIGDWLKDLQTQQVEARQYEYSPLTQVQQWSEIHADMPLFESLVVFENYPVSLLASEQRNDLHIEQMHTFEQTNYALTLMVAPATEILLQIGYDTRRFEADSIQRLAGHLQTLLEGMVANPQQQLAYLPLLTKAEQESFGWNSSSQPSQEHCLHQLFEQQVTRTPDAIALIWQDEQLSYQELNQRANALAHSLQARGIGPDTRVALCMERSIELLVSLLAILKAGGAYVPLDPAYPQQRLAFLLSDAQVALLLTQERLLTRIASSYQGPVLCLEKVETPAHDWSKANPQSRVTDRNLAYVIYTSGSTGLPKGVAIEHRSPVALVNWASEVFALEYLDGVLASTSVCFDLSIFELFVPLCRGGKVILIENVLHLSSLPARSGVTLLNTVPALMTELLQTQGVPNSVRVINLAGEPFQQSLARQLYQRKTLAQLFNLYGPSEDTTYSTFALIQKDAAGPPPIGHPITQTQAYLLDSHLQLVPVGVSAELHLGGTGLARGYLHRPDLTAEKFIPDPFSNQPGSRLYKTGDLARYRSDGSIEFLGRMDSQIKLRGFRIELTEIEAVLREHNSVHEALVIVHEDKAAEKQLVAYVTAQSQADLDYSTLRHYLQKQLPHYMVPSTFVLVEAFPLNANGKIDRRALPHPNNAGLKQAFLPVAPRTPMEEALVAIWSAVLRRETVGIYEDFFELGGHSLLATQVILRLRELLQRTLPLRVIFEAPTIASLAQRLTSSTQEELGLTLPPLLPRTHQEPVPLAFAQQRLWFLEQLDIDPALYIMAAALRMQGTLNVSALEECFNIILSRHESLRTIFLLHQGEPVQQVLPALTLSLPLIDLSGLALTQQETLLQQLATQDSEAPFRLAQGPLLRATLLRLNAQEHVLLLSMHHIVSDGWSLGVFQRELTLLYPSCCSHGTSPLSPLPIQYPDYALWQRQWLHGSALDLQRSFWLEQLQGAPLVLSLPTDFPRTPVLTSQGGRLRFTLPASLSQHLTTFSQQQGVTLFMTLLTAWSLLLSRYSGQDDLLIGTPIANRTHADLEALIGCFVNTLVLRADLTGNPQLQELLARIRQRCLDAYAHQDFPFERLVEALHPRRDLSHSPLFQAFFILQNAPVEALTLPDLHLTPLPIARTTASFEISLSMQPSPNGLLGVLEYNRDLFDPSTIAAMASQLQTLLTAMVSTPHLPISELPMLSSQERLHLLQLAITPTPAKPADMRSISERIEEMTHSRPDAIAVVCEDEQLTYHELDQRSTHLAYLLRTQGVGPEVLVGLCLERSPLLLIGLLAILKAGGAFVPLDPSAPPARLQQILQQSDTHFLLSTPTLAPLCASLSAALPDLSLLWLPALLQQPLPAPALLPQLLPQNLFCVLFTSGSTGQPKGVMLSHAGVLNHLSAKIEALHLSPADTLAQTASQSFVISLWQFLAPLLSGARLLILPTPTVQDPSLLLASLALARVSVLELVPSLLRVLLDLPTMHQGLPLPDLRWLILTGEALPPELVQRLRQRAPSLHLLNAYGPTEASDDVAHALLSASDEATGRSTPIGRPIANIRLLILDRFGQLAPPGVPGSLHIAGLGLSRGYLADPAQTAEVFLPDPFSSLPGTRLYRTGDLARWRPDGQLEYLGRVDQQVKVRGVRLELGEIESLLRQHPAILNAAARLWEPPDAAPRLLAYLVWRQQPATASLSEIRLFLQERLPESMLPELFLTLPKLPLNANGKLDRQALPAPERIRPEEIAKYIAPRTKTERTIAHIWQEVLQLEKVGTHDNFFDLGGHSLLMVPIHQKLKEAFGTTIALLDLFKYPSIDALTTYISQGEDTSATGRQNDSLGEKLQAGKSRVKQRFNQRQQASREQRSRQV